MCLFIAYIKYTFIISPIHNRYIMAIGNTHFFLGLRLNKNKILDNIY